MPVQESFPQLSLLGHVKFLLMSMTMLAKGQGSFFAFGSRINPGPAGQEAEEESEELEPLILIAAEDEEQEEQESFAEKVSAVKGSASGLRVSQETVTKKV